MEQKSWIEIKHLENFDEFDSINPIQITNDKLVNDFLNKDISLEAFIENEIYNTKL